MNILKQFDMEQLIKIRKKDGNDCVSARDVHVFLGIKKHFTQWFDDQKEWFVLNFDYTVINFEVKNQNNQGGRPSIDYAITLEMAKELCMMSKVEKGKKARQYFINCEKTLNQIKSNLPDFTNPAIAARAWADAIEQKTLAENQKILLESTIKEQAPKVEYYNDVLQSNKGWQTSIVAAELGMSAIKLNQILKDKGIQRKMNDTWILCANYQNKGYTKTKTHTYMDSQGNSQTSILTTWTETGREFIHNLIKESKAA